MGFKKNNPGCPCCGDCGWSLDITGDYGVRVDEGTIVGWFFYPNSFRRIVAFRNPDVPGTLIDINTQDRYLAHYANITAWEGNEPVFGMSSVDGRWKVYLQWETDDDYSGTTRLDTHTATLYKVEDGGSPVAIGGPYVLTARLGTNVLYVVCVYDENTNEISFSWYPVQNTTSNAMPWNPATAYPSTCVAERLKDADDNYVQTRCPHVGVFSGWTGVAGWTARLCVCSGAMTGSSPYWIQGKVPTGQKFSKWPAGIRATFSGVTSPWDETDYYYDDPRNELNGDHDFGSLSIENHLPSSVCTHVCRREIMIYQPFFSPVIVFTSILGLDLSLVSTYDSAANETTITMSGYIKTPSGYLSGAYYGNGYFGQAIIFSKVFAGDKDVRFLDDDLDLVSWAAGIWDFSNASLRLTTLHP